MNQIDDFLRRNPLPSGTNPRMATGRQLRAARAALGWSIARLAEASGVSMRTIDRYEAAVGVPMHRSRSLAALVSCLEAGGIEFIRSREDLPGILIRECCRPQGERD